MHAAARGLSISRAMALPYVIVYKAAFASNAGGALPGRAQLETLRQLADQHDASAAPAAYRSAHGVALAAPEERLMGWRPYASASPTVVVLFLDPELVSDLSCCLKGLSHGTLWTRRLCAAWQGADTVASVPGASPLQRVPQISSNQQEAIRDLQEVLNCVTAPAAPQRTDCCSMATGLFRPCRATDTPCATEAPRTWLAS